MTILLALLYPIAVQYDRGGRWRLLAPLTLLTIGVNMLANYTELALLTWDFPQPGEHTFSQRLKRLVRDDGWRGVLARGIAEVLNYFAPDGRHVPTTTAMDGRHVPTVIAADRRHVTTATAVDMSVNNAEFEAADRWGD